MSAPLPQRFYAGDALEVARALLGCHVEHGEVVVRITEVEAYRGVGDSAAHARFGPTARTRTLFGPPGRAYVYLCYGVHWMLNFVTTGDGSAILVRAAEPIRGIERIRARRGGLDGPALLAGPGRLAAALALDRAHDGLAVHDPAGPLRVTPGAAPARVVAGPRVGIDFASPRDRRARWRLAIAGTPWVSHPKSLRPA